MICIGIDPGKNGAIAIIKGEEITTHVFDEEAYMGLLRMVAEEDEMSGCCLERVSAMPGQGVTGMFNFGMNFGFIQGLLSAFEIPYELVRPQTWKKAFGITKDKNTSVQVCKRLFPAVNLYRTERCTKPHDGIAEAVLMCEYARREMGR